MINLVFWWHVFVICTCVGQGDCIGDDSGPRVTEGERHDISGGTGEGAAQCIGELGEGHRCRLGHRL